MKPIFLLWLLLALARVVSADNNDFQTLFKASLVFREENNEAAGYPHLILIYLRLENQGQSDREWVCNTARGIEAEVLDANGHPVRGPAAMASISSQYSAYRLPYRSSMDWFITGGGISMVGDRKSNAALVVGSRGWLLPRDSLASYSLKLKVTGVRSSSHTQPPGKEQLLFDIPPTPIIIGK